MSLKYSLNILFRGNVTTLSSSHTMEVALVHAVNTQEGWVNVHWNIQVCKQREFHCGLLKNLNSIRSVNSILKVSNRTPMTGLKIIAWMNPLCSKLKSEIQFSTSSIIGLKIYCLLISGIVRKTQLKSSTFLYFVCKSV